MITPALSTLLEDFRSDLLACLERRAGWLLRFESAEDLWQGLVKDAPQIHLVLNGHVMGRHVGYRVDKATAGHDVHQMLFNAQGFGGGSFDKGNGGDGWMRLMEFLLTGPLLGYALGGWLLEMLWRTTQAVSLTPFITEHGRPLRLMFFPLIMFLARFVDWAWKRHGASLRVAVVLAGKDRRRRPQHRHRL